MKAPDNWRNCPTPTKRKFISESGAQANAARFPDRRRGDPRRAYRCTCGFWHLTSKAAGNPEG